MTETEQNEYRNRLVAAEQKSQDDYDKAIVSLSGGALGISILFIKDIIGNREPIMDWLVITAWGLWAASLASVVISYFLSRLALRKAIEQTDKKDFSDGVGGKAASATQFFNAASGILFVLGVVFLILFSANNMGGKTMSDGDKRVERGYIPPPPPKPDPATGPSEPLTEEGVIPEPPPPPPPEEGE